MNSEAFTLVNHQKMIRTEQAGEREKSKNNATVRKDCHLSSNYTFLTYFRHPTIAHMSFGDPLFRTPTHSLI
jgi:hypothetical protein